MLRYTNANTDETRAAKLALLANPGDSNVIKKFVLAIGCKYFLESFSILKSDAGKLNKDDFQERVIVLIKNGELSITIDVISRIEKLHECPLLRKKL